MITVINRRLPNCASLGLSLHHYRCNVESWQMQTWDAVRLQMLGWGYSRVLTIELACLTCGTWRGELPDEQDSYACPVCTEAAKVSHILEGFTRRITRTEWRQISKPLSDKAREWVLGENFLEDRGLLAQQRRQRHENDRYHRMYGNRRKAGSSAVRNPRH